MQTELRFVALLVPYVALVIGCVVVGASFFVPTVVFGAIGERGLLAAVVAVVVSSAAIFRTDDALLTTLQDLTR